MACFYDKKKRQQKRQKKNVQQRVFTGRHRPNYELAHKIRYVYATQPDPPAPPGPVPAQGDFVGGSEGMVGGCPVKGCPVHGARGAVLLVKA